MTDLCSMPLICATVSWPRCLLRTLTKRSISCRESFFLFLSLWGASGRAKPECKPEQVSVVSEEAFSIQTALHNSPLGFVWLSIENLPLPQSVFFKSVFCSSGWAQVHRTDLSHSLPLFISLCFSFSRSALTGYQTCQFAYEIGWKAKLVEAHWVKAVTHTCTHRHVCPFRWLFCLQSSTAPKDSAECLN